MGGLELQAKSFAFWPLLSLVKCSVQVPVSSSFKWKGSQGLGVGSERLYYVMEITFISSCPKCNWLEIPLIKIVMLDNTRWFGPHRRESTAESGPVCLQFVQWFSYAAWTTSFVINPSMGAGHGWWKLATGVSWFYPRQEARLPGSAPSLMWVDINVFGVLVMRQIMVLTGHLYHVDATIFFLGCSILVWKQDLSWWSLASPVLASL